MENPEDLQKVDNIKDQNDTEIIYTSDEEIQNIINQDS
jgi:hypothetical protein